MQELLPQPQMILLVLARRHPRQLAEMYPRYAPANIADENIMPHLKALYDAGYIEPFNLMYAASGMFSLTDDGIAKQKEVDPYIEWDDAPNDLRRLRVRDEPFS